MRSIVRKRNAGLDHEEGKPRGNIAKENNKDRVKIRASNERGSRE